MTVILRSSRDLPASSEFTAWAAIDAPSTAPAAARRVKSLGAQLERAFEAIRHEWWALARELGSAPSAWAAHAPAAAPNVSDLGLMLAWTRLVDSWAANREVILVVCDDPWMFRHLAQRPGIRAGVVPALAGRSLRLKVRGWIARALVAFRTARAALLLRRHRRILKRSDSAILVYGHPSSRADGHDAYFGGLMLGHPSLIRVLHTDCEPAQARRLLGDNRTASLHAWGSPFVALSLLGACWRPRVAHLQGPSGWLVRRAALLENSRGNIAMTHWQAHCQERWLIERRPRNLAWPWENHPWERALVRAARRECIRTIGYQHSVVGRHMLNYAAHSNPDGATSLPQHVLCVGQSTCAQLSRWQIPSDRLAIGGALRFPTPLRTRFAATAPVFVALPFGGNIAAEMLSAALDLASAGWRVLVKDHPMTPFPLTDAPNLTRTTRALSEQDEVSAVVYAATTVGLEARLAGLPVIRFRSTVNIALDILPDEINSPTTERESIVADVERLIAAGSPAALARAGVFAAENGPLWSELLPASEGGLVEQE